MGKNRGIPGGPGKPFGPGGPGGPGLYPGSPFSPTNKQMSHFLLPLNTFLREQTNSLNLIYQGGLGSLGGHNLLLVLCRQFYPCHPFMNNKNRITLFLSCILTQFVSREYQHRVSNFTTECSAESNLLFFVFCFFFFFLNSSL